MSKQEIIVKQGTFSKLTITLNDDVINKLALIKQDNNPLAKVEIKLNKILIEFEKAYFKEVSK